MRISDIITPAAIAVQVHMNDKAHALKYAAAALGTRSGLDPARIRDALSAREALGSTGIGGGVAVPHVCFPDLEQSYGFFCTLAEPIDFGSIDDEPVDLICTIISPTGSRAGSNECLSHLAAISRILRNKDRSTSLRRAKNPWDVHDVIVKSMTTAAHCVS